MRVLISLYNVAGRSLGRVPNDEAEFRQACEEKATPMLKQLELSSFDDLLISERDGKPFVVIYRNNRPKRISREVVAYEQDGIDGKRQVGMSLGMIELLDDAKFRELVPVSSE